MRRALLLLFALAGCHRPSDPSPHASSPPVNAPAPAPVPVPAPAPVPVPAEPPAPAVVERFDVKGDLPASIVRALDAKDPRTVFVAGLCSNANAYLQSFPESARKHGGAIAVEGDQRCTDDGMFRSYSWDATKLNARIEKALAAAGVDPFPTEGVTLVGYSQGAALGEQLAARWPSRYPRLVVIGAPTEPNAANFAKTKGVVTMSCSLDVPARMRDASKRIKKAGVPSTYLEMPKCHHGHVADAERVFDEAFSFFES
jgi:pimeloyl-ACP methyl ester carboxylesterase